MKMKDIEVRELESSEYKLWDDLVKKSPHGTIFHTSDWLAICNESFNGEFEIYGCFRNEELIGGCSLFINKLKGFFTIASSTCKMTPYGGLVLKQSPSNKVQAQESLHNAVIEAFQKYIKIKKFDYISLSNSPDFKDIRPFTYNKWTPNVKYAYYFDLTNDRWVSLSKNARWNIKKAEKNGVVIRKETNPQVYNELFKMTFDKQNLIPPVSLGFFENMLDMLTSNNSGEMWIAEMPSGEPISAEINIWDNKRAYGWSAASNGNFKNIGSSSLLQFTTLQDLKSRDFKEINVMAANTPRLTKFISSFNPKLVPYYSISSSNLIYRLSREICNYFIEFSEGFK